MKKQEAVENQQVVQDTLQKWVGFKRHLLKAFTQEPISPEDEQEFLEIKSQVSKNARLLGQRLKSLSFEGDRISSVLRQCISVSQLRSMPVPDRRGLYKEWHAIFVHLNSTEGALEFIAQGWVPIVIEEKSGTSIADIKRMSGRSEKGGGKGKKKGMMVPIVVAIVVVAAGAAFWYLSQ